MQGYAREVFLTSIGYRRFLAELSHELVVSPVSLQKLIDDPKDTSILNTAILSDVDIIISGNHHFLHLDMEHPKPNSQRNI